MSRISNLSSRIFVGGLNQAVDEGDLEKAFNLFGEITNVMVMRDRENGRSRGFAFISFKDTQSSEEAISRMHGVEIRGKCVSVRHAERTKFDKVDSQDRRSHDGDRPSFSRYSSQATRSQTFYGIRNFSASDTVYVTNDDGQDCYKNSRNSLEIGKYRGHSPTRTRTGEESGSNDILAYLTEEKNSLKRKYHERSGRLDHDQLLLHDSYSDEDEMSPARERKNYINSRGKSLSPLLQLSQKLSSDATEREDRKGFDRSFQFASRCDAATSRDRYLDHHSKARQSRHILEKARNRLSPRRGQAFQRLQSPRLKDKPPECNHVSKRRHDYIAEDFSTSFGGNPRRRSLRMSPIVSKRSARSMVSESPPSSPSFNRNSPQPHTAEHRYFEGHFSHDFDSNGRSHGRRPQRRQGEDFNSREENWRKSALEGGRRGHHGLRTSNQVRYSDGQRPERRVGDRLSSRKWQSPPHDLGHRNRMNRGSSSDTNRNWNTRKFRSSRGGTPQKRLQVS